MICLRNWDSPWRGNGRTHLNCWLVKGHAITLSGIAKTVNMCKSPSSFLTQNLGGSGSQREGILPEELFTFAPVTLLIYILLKGEKEWGCAPSAAECWQAQHVAFPGCFASFPSAPAYKWNICHQPCGCPGIRLHWWTHLEGKAKGHKWQCLMQDAQGMALWRFSESQFSRLVIGESSKSGIPDSEKVSQRCSWLLSGPSWWSHLSATPVGQWSNQPMQRWLGYFLYFVKTCIH